jgi:4-amino-4-deoxy-L-arabinose transferase-like glycosyltransferase
LLVVIFFSFSTGKRGVYILPALPAFCLALAPYLLQWWQRAGVRRVFFGLAITLSIACLLLATYLSIVADKRAQIVSLYGIDAPAPLLCIGVLGVLICLVTRVRHAGVAWLGTLTVVLCVMGLWLSPRMNDIRSSKAFVRSVEAATAAVPEFGWVAYSEENLLMAHRTIVNFGHSRWRQWEQEADDAAAWQAAKPGRVLLIDQPVRARCFAQTRVQSLTDGNGETYYLVNAGADPACVQRGHLDAALTYVPPTRW